MIAIRHEHEPHTVVVDINVHEGKFVAEFEAIARKMVAVNAGSQVGHRAVFDL
jgi:hypothetical protein